eukprot:RCo044368
MQPADSAKHCVELLKKALKKVEAEASTSASPACFTHKELQDVLELLKDHNTDKARSAIAPGTDYIAELQKHRAPFDDAVAPMTKSDVLIVIDMQNDFVESHAFVQDCGAFAVLGGARVSMEVVRLIEQASKVGATIIATRDYHPKDHVSFNTSKDSQGKPGPFPPHCVQGSPGAYLVHPVKKALQEARRKHPDNVHIVFKGFNSAVDSFGAFPYPESAAKGRLARCAGCELNWTGAEVLPCSYQDQDLDAPPDVLAIQQRKPLLELLGDRSRRLLLCGLAMDYCVLDTALNATLASPPFTKVSIVYDACGAAFARAVGPHLGGYFTHPEEMAGKLTRHGVSLVPLSAVL